MSAQAQFPDEQSPDGAFERQQDAFRDWVTADGSSGYPAEPGRYHLYVCYACPWAHRTIIARTLKGLEEVVGLTAVDPIRTEAEGWAFREGRGHGADPVNGFRFLSEAYRASDPTYHARVTVPVLWDKRLGRIVSNSDDDILRMFNTAFNAFATKEVDLVPAAHAEEIDALNELIYRDVNNGVYEAGFATAQAPYEAAVRRLFDALDTLEARLATRRFLFGPQPLETDWRLFPTLIRFDAVYHGHFKCNLRQLAGYPNLFAYTRDLYQWPGVAATVNFDHIKRHYYITHDDINPTRIVPLGPDQDWDAPPGREMF